MNKRSIVLFFSLLCVVIVMGSKKNPAKTKECRPQTQKVLATNTVSVDSIHQSKSNEIEIGDVEVDFPKDGPQPLLDSLQAFVSQELHSYCGYEENKGEYPLYPGNLKDGNAMAQFYAQSYFQTLKQFEDGPLPNVQLELNVGLKKEYESDKVFVYRTEGYTYMGGAHGAAWVYAKMFDKATGKQIKDYIIDSTEVEGMQEMLTAGLKSYFKANVQPYNDDLKEMLQLSDDIIPLPDTPPFFTKDGVKFIYQQYEIGAYAIGMPTFTIPYKNIYFYLTPEAKKYISGK